MSDLLALAHDLGMAALLEVHTVEELERVLPLRPPLIGINNRDLRTFQTDIETTLQLLPLIPDDVVVVSESGINTGADIARLCGQRRPCVPHRRITDACPRSWSQITRVIAWYT